MICDKLLNSDIAKFDLAEKTKLQGFLSALKVAGNVSMSLSGVVFDRKPRSRTKIQQAYTQLIGNNANSHEVSFIFDEPSNKVVFFSRILVRFLRITFYAAMLNKHTENGRQLFAQLLTNLIYDTAKDKVKAYVVISDLSLNRCAFWRSFERMGAKIIWHQHSLDLSVVPEIFYHADYVMLKNDHGLYHLKNMIKSSNKPVITRQDVFHQGLEVTIPPKISSVGIAVNAWFRLSESERMKIGLITKILKLESINLLLHPRTNVDVVHKCKNLQLFRTYDSMSKFLHDSDLIIAGNSQIQLDALMHGKMVVHTSNIDPGEFDKLKYCARGLVHGLEKFEDFSVENVNTHYRDVSFKNKFRHIYSFKEISEAPRTDMILSHLYE